MIYEVYWHTSIGRSFVEAESFAEANEKVSLGKDFGFDDYEPSETAVVEKEPVDEQTECDIRQGYECRGCDKKAECDKDELKRQEQSDERS